MNAPTGPLRAARPMPNSAIMIGNDQTDEKDEPGNQERRAAVLGRYPRKAPDVSGPDGHTQTGQDERPPGREDLPCWFRHGVWKV